MAWPSTEDAIPPRHYEERAESGVNVESRASGASRFDVAAKARGSDESIQAAEGGKPPRQIIYGRQAHVFSDRAAIVRRKYPSRA